MVYVDFQNKFNRKLNIYFRNAIFRHEELVLCICGLQKTKVLHILSDYKETFALVINENKVFSCLSSSFISFTLNNKPREYSEYLKSESEYPTLLIRPFCFLYEFLAWAHRYSNNAAEGSLEVEGCGDRVTDWILAGQQINPLKPELNSICYFLALLGSHHFLHVSRIMVKLLTFRLLLSYIYGAPILDVSRSHTTTQHSR